MERNIIINNTLTATSQQQQQTKTIVIYSDFTVVYICYLE